MKKRAIINTLDQCTANADAVRALCRPDKAREFLAESRANILNEVTDYLVMESASGRIESLLSYITFHFGMYATIERDRSRNEIVITDDNCLPSFGVLNDWMQSMADIILFIVKLGETQDAVNRAQESLILQSEREGHTFVK